MLDTYIVDNDTFKFYFQIRSRKFIDKEHNPSGKIVIVKEKLDKIDKDGIGNLVDLPRLMFILVVIDGGELIRNINRKKSEV